MKNDYNRSVERNLRRNSGYTSTLPTIRSWEAQSTKTPTGSKQAEDEFLVQNYHNKPSIFHNRDFRVIVSIIITGIIAAAVYYGMKDS